MRHDSEQRTVEKLTNHYQNHIQDIIFKRPGRAWI